MPEQDYKYFHSEDAHNTRAAEQLVPFLMKLFNPSSVLDVGCGTGTWISVFSNYNSINRLLGLDSKYINMEKVIISSSMLKKIDLAKSFDLEEKFDLVMSLEVAEHLPKSSADSFVRSLVKHGDVIVFSAAIPGQGGDNHLNEQWQSYWAKLFEDYGFFAYDIIRPEFWNNSNVDMWYKQNTVVYSRINLPYDRAKCLDIIHPDYWEAQNNKMDTFKIWISRIRGGKAGIFFYLKILFRSILHGGRKS